MKSSASLFTGLFYRYKRLLIMSALLGMVLNLLSLATPLSFMAVIDRVLISEGYATLNVILVILLVTALLTQFLQAGQFHVSQWTALGMGSESAGVFYKHLFRLKQSYFDQTPVGEIVSRTAELDRVRGILTSWILSLAVDFTFMLVFLVVMLTLSAPLTFVVLATVPLHVGQYFIFGPSLKRRERENFEAGVNHQSAVIESLQGIETVRVSGRVDSQLEGIFSTLDFRLRKAYRLAQVGMWSSRLSEFIGAASEALILYYGAMLVLGLELTLGELVAFNMMKDRVTSPLIRLASIWEEVLAFRLSVERLNTVLHYEMEQSDSPSKALKRVDGFKQEIAFKNLSFCYPGHDNPAVSGISLDIRKGERICLLGESGAGKSTLTRLLTMVYDNYQGDICFDGIELRELDLESVRQQAYYVLQKNMLFRGTVASNILYASKNQDPKWAKRCAEIACASEFIEKLPLGYETPVLEGARNFSGGEIQRIALARAIAADTPIIVLDEATSALDYETESNVVNNLEQLGDEKTLVIVTHRLSLARICDRIIVLKDGGIIEEGNHDELIKKAGAYRRLYEYQFGDVERLALVPSEGTP